MKRLCSMAMGGLLALTATRGTTRAEEAEQRRWKATVNAYLFAVPDQESFFMVTAPVEIRWFHVEARYNYEALRSGSVFAGVNAGWGQALRLDLTPMIGGLFGELDGLVPALRWTLTWWKLDLYSESEVVVDFDDASDSFFYNWSELGFSPLDWLRFGGAIQRSRVLMTSLDFQRGLFVAATIRLFTVSLYEFNLGWATPTWVGAVSVTF
jgi:hypothetical protein